MMYVASYIGKRGGVNGLFDATVRFGTHGSRSHSELVVADGTSWTASKRDGGVRPKMIDFKPHHWEFIPVLGGDEERALAVFKAEKGKKYDTLGLFGFGLRPITGEKERWFCSEIVAYALGFADPWRFCPNGLHAAIVGRNQAIIDYAAANALPDPLLSLPAPPHPAISAQTVWTPA